VTHENKQPKSKKPNYKQQPRKFQDKPVLTTSSTLHKECRFCGYKHENKKENVQHGVKLAMRARAETISS